MGSPHLTEKEKKRIQQLRDEGHAHAEIAKKVKRSRGAVARALLRDAKKEKAPEVRRLLDAGATYKHEWRKKHKTELRTPLFL